MNRWPNAWSACAAHQADDGVFSDKVLLHDGEEALVPLLRRRLRAELREVDDHRQRAFGGQPLGGADHQARLAHLARRQDVAEVAGAAVLEQVAIGAAAPR